MPTALLAACLPLLTACSGGKNVKPLPPGEVQREYPPAPLIQKEARPVYQPGREWAYVVEYADELEEVIARYECKMERLAEWAAGRDPAKLECGTAE